MPCNQQSNIHTVYQTQFFAKLQAKLTAFLNIYWTSIKSDFNYNGIFGKALGAIGKLSFGKLCKWILKS
jgi:hypothetical protein